MAGLKGGDTPAGSLEPRDEESYVSGQDVGAVEAGPGDDVYFVDNPDQVISEAVGGGFDRVFASVSYILSAGAEIEVLSTGDWNSTAAIDLTGNEFSQEIYGNAGSNRLASGGGADVLIGMGGNDTFLVEGDDLVLENSGGGDRDVVFASLNYSLAAASHVEVLSTDAWSSSAAINLTGNELAQEIYGNAGTNTLTGGGGADILVGFGGNDNYYIDDAAASVVEGAAEGARDAVFSSVNYSLDADVHVEVLSTSSWGSAVALDLTGNAQSQEIFGNAGVNVLTGGGGADILVGFGGNDSYYVDSADDVVVEGVGEGGRDAVFASSSYALGSASHIEILSAASWSSVSGLNLTGNGLANEIYGNAGTNNLDGGGGADMLVGFGGNDTYFVDHAGDLVIEGQAEGARDVVFAAANYTLREGVHVEVLSTADWSSTAAADLTGNALANEIYGNAGVNILTGGGGSDVLVGFNGNDSYYVDADDIVVEGVGGGARDVVYTNTDYSLAASAAVEVLSSADWSAVAAINLSGNAFANEIYGNAGSNIITGGGGSDTLVGFAGDDIYHVDSADDVILESSGQGRDSVFSSASFGLAAGVEVEILSTASWGGTGTINLTGNEFANEIFGNAGQNVLDGRGGNDVLTGFQGADTFSFSTAIMGASNIDRINGFAAGEDRILLGGSAGEPFAALASGQLSHGFFKIGSAATEVDDRIIYNSATGALLYDADGLGGVAAVQFATLDAGLALTAADFIVSGPANGVPVMSSGTAATIAENSPTDTVIYQATATDPDGDSIVFSLSGADANLFTIDQTGAVRLRDPADFETRASYTFTVSVMDSSGTGSSKDVTLTVTDVNETPPAGAYVVTETTAFNDTQATAQELDRSRFAVVENANVPNDDLPSARIEGSLSSNADKDFFSITLEAGELLILDVDGTTNDLDALLRVIGPGGFTMINDDLVDIDPGSSPHAVYGHNTDSYVQFRAPTSGTYTFSIESFEAGSSGSYVIHASRGPVASRAQIDAENISALIAGPVWTNPNVTYSFTTDPSQYAGSTEATNNFEVLNGTQQAVVRSIFSHVSTVASLTFTEVLLNPGSAQMRFAMSDNPETAHAYYPGTGEGGDSWYNNTSGTYDNPVIGNYAYMTFLHEIGHALGLKHGHESPALNYAQDSMEFSIMTYRGYIGAPTGEDGGYRNETWGFAQTLMMYDIAALQRMYGANFGTQSGDSVYTWNSSTGQFSINGAGQWTPGANRVFMTIWDGGGNDTYNLSSYTSSVTIDLRPGEWTTTSQTQLAFLGDGRFARGNVANSLLFNGDTRSLIENAVGGSGNDILIGNQALNRLTGGGGADTFRYHSYTDSGLGGMADILTDFTTGSDRIDLSAIDANMNSTSNDAFTFIGTGAFTGVAGQLRYEVSGNSVRILADIDGNGVADMSIIANSPTITVNDFIL